MEFLQNLALYLMASVARIQKNRETYKLRLIQRKGLKNYFARSLTNHVLMMRKLVVQLKH